MNKNVKIVKICATAILVIQKIWQNVYIFQIIFVSSVANSINLKIKKKFCKSIQVNKSYAIISNSFWPFSIIRDRQSVKIWNQQFPHGTNCCLNLYEVRWILVVMKK